MGRSGCSESASALPLLSRPCCSRSACAGTAVAMRPTAEMLAGSEDTHALAALLSEPSAVAAYDHVPVRSAAAVFTMDTASEVFMLHSAKARFLPTLCKFSQQGFSSQSSRRSMLFHHQV